MRKIATSRQQGFSWNAYEPDDGLQDLYADGYMGMFVGPAVAKVGFFTTTGISQEDGAVIEERMMRFRLTLPTSSLLEMCLQVLQNVKENQDALSTALQSTLKKSLDQIAMNSEKEKSQP